MVDIAAVDSMEMKNDFPGEEGFDTSGFVATNLKLRRLGSSQWLNHT